MSKPSLCQTHQAPSGPEKQQRARWMLLAKDSGRRIISDVSGLLGAFLIVASLYFAREVFIPLCLAGLITFLLAPIATKLEAWRIPRGVSGVLVIGLTAISVGSIAWIVLGQVYNLALELPRYQENISQKVNALHLDSAGRLTATVQMLGEVSRQISADHADTSSASPPFEPVRRGAKGSAGKKIQPDSVAVPAGPVNVRIEEPRTSWASVVATDVRPLIGPLTSAFAVIIFVVFMLLARDDIRDRTVRLMGSNRIHVTTVAMSDAATRVSRYLLMQFVVNLGYGVMVGCALWFIGVPHPLLWAVTTFLLRFVPYVGILAAGTGPVLLALAASSNWSTACWTLGLYIVLELLAANAVEPYLYGSSTGVSALAILVAAIFWTWVWGIPGLLLSTPLTVCLIVVGQHVPRLEFLGVLFGEKTVLDLPQRLYQRILASDSKDAGKLIQEEVKISSRESAYDKMIIPTLSLVEDARHTEQLEGERAELALQMIQDLLEEQWTEVHLTSDITKSSIVCVAVKDLADDIACQLLKQVLSETHTVETLASDLLSADVIETISRVQPKAICVVGIPPQAVRHIRVRCHQLRNRFPEITIVACVFSIECDLANVRSRIPMHDSNHVVCSLEQAHVYLNSVTLSSSTDLKPGAIPSLQATSFSRELPLDETCEDIFEQIATTLAKAFEAPIALIHIHGEGNEGWQAQWGLPESEKSAISSLRTSPICAEATSKGGLIVPDIALDLRFQNDSILLDNGVRFFAGTPISGLEDEAIGSLCVFDTRPRQVTQQQQDCLNNLAHLVANAIALQRE